MSTNGELLHVETTQVPARVRRVRRGVHVRALVEDLGAAVARYRARSHASKATAAARAGEIVRKMGEVAR